MEERNFMQLLQARWDQDKFVCVGLDSDTSHPKFPPHLLERFTPPQALLRFNIAIVDATHHLVCAYKPNSAFYEMHGEGGLWALGETIHHINRFAPDVPVILDAKRGDIGNTNDGYVAATKAADAVTVHPYLGMEAMKPFLDQKDKGIIVLCRTSNPGAGEFQDLICDVYEDGKVLHACPEDALGMESLGVGIIKQTPLYQVVAQNVANSWNYNGNCAVVVGATYPEELVKVRKIVGDMPILLPGIGAQGGDLEATVKAGANSRDQGMIINNSRGIIFASSGEDFAEDAGRATQEMHDNITAVLAAA